MRFHDTIGRVATSRYTARVALTLTMLALFALAADPTAAACDCQEFPNAPGCDEETLTA